MHDESSNNARSNFTVTGLGNTTSCIGLCKKTGESSNNLENQIDKHDGGYCDKFFSLGEVPAISLAELDAEKICDNQKNPGLRPTHANIAKI